MSYYIDRPEGRTIWEKIYIPEILRGLFITGRHFLKNLIFMNRRMTVEYPDVKRKMPPGYRAEHRLMRREDGTIRCTACMLCATICPSSCIDIEAEEINGSPYEKRAKTYIINELRCVFCGLCVEACPCDAIRMDSGRYENASFNRSTLIYTKEKLLENGAPGSSSLSVAL